MSIAEYPCLRAIEAVPVEREGETWVALRDPAGYTPSVIMVPAALLEMVALFDGEHSIVDIQADLMRRHGEIITREHIETLIEALDGHGFLESPSFAARRAAIETEFLAARSRPATHAGGAYADDPVALRAAMDGFFTSPDGPGPIAARNGGAPVRGLVAPHIDFHRGGPAYAWAYRDLAERGDADCFVIFGTCHAGMAQPFALTRKDFDTPLGPARVDAEFVDALAARAKQDCFGSELAHRNEHSIEFQAVFLQYLYAGRREITVVPVLTSFVHEALARGRRPEDDACVRAFLDALAETVAASRRKVAFIAGADLAHMGTRFGDAPVSPAELERIGREDRAMLERMEAGDADGFFDSVRADNDRRRICGLSPIYTLLRALGGTRGQLRRYGQWPDPEGVVTFASVVY
ncbi:MAG TPA: AmmeMemoRadiSam system protein B [Methylomirabilota bacterium]|nr:AmmeMemoRadiSam system protein B [Methylomirabilota bacterium]